MNLKKKKKGFTLIELMAVIAIIAILAAVLVPTVTGYINRAKKTAIITQARNVVSAIETYNATAAKKDQINLKKENASKVKVDVTLADIRTKVGTDFLGVNSINKLPSTTPYRVLLAINTNSDAINNILVDEDGVLKQYSTEDDTENYWAKGANDVPIAK